MLRKVIVGVIFGSALMALAGCSDGPRATKALEGAGYTNVVTTGYAFFGCSEDDRVHTGFRATDQRGNQVTGTYCSGLLFKGGTIRLD